MRKRLFAPYFTAKPHRVRSPCGRTATKRRPAGDGRARCADALSSLFHGQTPPRALRLRQNSHEATSCWGWPGKMRRRPFPLFHGQTPPRARPLRQNSHEATSCWGWPGRCANALSPLFHSQTPPRARRLRRHGRKTTARARRPGRCADAYPLLPAPCSPFPAPSSLAAPPSGHLPTRSDAQSSSLSPRGRPAASKRHQALLSKTAFRRSPHEQEQRIHPRHHPRRAHHHQ